MTLPDHFLLSNAFNISLHGPIFTPTLSMNQAVMGKARLIIHQERKKRDSPFPYLCVKTYRYDKNVRHEIDPSLQTVKVASAQYDDAKIDFPATGNWTILKSGR